MFHNIFLGFFSKKIREIGFATYQKPPSKLKFDQNVTTDKKKNKF